ncbi:MAG TPA: type II toxin-antitoxin system prevent-host-death family antitoxin [Caulobacteraceae bacterium]|jgi:prevent-host-death family protein
MIFNMHQAKTQLSKLVAAALAGEEVVIARDGTPLVTLTPVATACKPTGRRPGTLKGLIGVPDDAAFAPLSEDELREWEDGPVYPVD